MMAKISANTVTKMLIVLCMAILIQTGLASPSRQIPGLLQEQSPFPDIENCWSALTNIPSCLEEINSSLSSGQIGKIGPDCCNAINQITDNCWLTMLTFNPMLPLLLKSFCAAPPPQAAAKNAAGKMVSLQQPLPPVFNETEITECWSSILNTEGCALEIYKSLTTGQITGIGPACCKALTEIIDTCWPKMFPFNPFFPPLLKDNCAKVTGGAQAPKAN